MKPLIILTGPTAVGKTALSLKLAKEINGEIISADSMQVYRDMNIGTAKISQTEMDGVPHHLIDIMNPDEDFNVTLFKNAAVDAMNKIYEKGCIPIITGGTGFYIQSVLYDISFEENDDSKGIRTKLESYYKENGIDKLHELLAECDPESAASIHKNNVKRVIRAIEFNRQTGKKISEHNTEQQLRKSPYNYLYFVLNDDRSKLYERIDTRVDDMVNAGLVNEVKKLHNKFSNRTLVSMQGLGYKEIIAALEDECSMDEAITTIKNETRHFAKRQLTWFRREKSVTWINRQDFNNDNSILDYMISLCKEKGLI